MAGVETKRVGAGEDGMRLDRWFKTHYAALPHSRLEKLLRTGQVRVDGARAKASTRLAEGQAIRVPPLPDVAPPPAPKHRLSKADRDPRIKEGGIAHRPECHQARAPCSYIAMLLRPQGG